MVIELLLLRAALPLLKRTMPIQRLAALMWASNVRSRDAGDVLTLQSVVERGGRVLVSSNCLERSLVLYRLFSRAGAAPTLMLGARHEGPRLAGHAWIEMNGQSWGEPDAASYARFVMFGQHGAARPADRLNAA
jgi:hypothetical protein